MFDMVRELEEICKMTKAFYIARKRLKEESEKERQKKLEFIFTHATKAPCEEKQFNLYDGVIVRYRNGKADRLIRSKEHSNGCLSSQYKMHELLYSAGYSNGLTLGFCEHEWDIVEVLSTKIWDPVILEKPKRIYDLKKGMIVELNDGAHMRLLEKYNDTWKCETIKNADNGNISYGDYPYFTWDQYGIDKFERNIVKVLSNEPEEKKTYDLKPGMVLGLRDRTVIKLIREKTKDDTWYCKNSWIAEVATYFNLQNHFCWDKYGIAVNNSNPDADIVRVIHEPKVADKITLEVGEFYKTRNGKRVVFYKQSGAESFCIYGVVIDGYTGVWKKDGTYSVDSKENELDIISKWDD